MDIIDFQKKNITELHQEAVKRKIDDYHNKNVLHIRNKKIKFSKYV